MTTKPLCPSLGCKEVLCHSRRSSDLCLKRLPVCLLRITPMTDFRQRQAISTLTAPAARGLTPHSLVQPDTRLALYPATGIHIHLFLQNKKRLWRSYLIRQNITITILGKYSIDHSRSPDSHLKRLHTLPSQVAPMTGFRQRIYFSMPTVLVNAGIWKNPDPILFM